MSSILADFIVVTGITRFGRSVLTALLLAMRRVHKESWDM